MNSMTDITELAQREKFEAWLEGAEALPWGYLKNRRASDSEYLDPNITDMWAAWKGASAELVEALEKAQGMETYWKTQCRGITDHCEELQARIAELESSVIAPDILRCSECSFVQTKNIISVTADTITTVESESELCPNGCGPLQPVTWKALAIQLMFTTKQGVSDLLEAKKRIAEMESRTVKLPDALDFDCEMENGDYDIDEEPYLRGKVDGFNHALTKIRRLNGTAGIKWEAE